ncbi:MAG: hypothetical protein K8F25_08600 [Fimbriimonadaceae bacterium]|nr:hypothetical protein [Alphaproteobacteria bacterium]
MTEMALEEKPEPEIDGILYHTPFDRELLKGTNINADTLLATDFLNHFNEIAMLIEMLPTMPEAIDDITAWQTWTYEEHFRKSGLRDADLAISAYHHAPEVVRITFDDTIERMNHTVIQAGIEAKELLETGHDLMIAEGVNAIALEIRSLVDETSALINGGSIRRDNVGDAAQTAVDALFD